MPLERDDPVAEWHQRLQIAARNAIREDDITEIMKAIVKDAKLGNQRARELILKFLQLEQPAASKTPVLTPPAQQIKAQTVNVYTGGKRRKPKLLIDQPKEP